jgi:hypothetical protein
MKSDKEKWTIVIIGLWDRRLFALERVSKELFDGKQVEVEVPMNLTFPFRFNAEGLVLIPQNDRVIIGIKNINDDSLNKAENLARKVLGTFPQVPINSFGINFGFIEEAPGELAALYNLSDIDKLSDNNYKIRETEIKRKLEYERGDLNITHSFNEGIVRIHFNFHHPCNSMKSAIELLNNSVIKCKDLAKDFLKKVYGLTLEEE